MRILVVEDEERSRNGISRLIHSIDERYFVVAQAANGIEALEKIRYFRPDAVLTDIKMPNMDGLALIEKAHSENLRPHFVIISAYPEFDYAQKAMSYGVRDFIVKPVTYDDLEEVLQKIKSYPIDPLYIQTRSDFHPLVRKVLCEIKDHTNQRILLDNIAATLRVTPEYLSTLFSQEMGDSFSHYVQKYKIELAKEMLREDGVKIADVAEKLGFSDTKYFNKIFKKVCGVSPSKYYIGKG